MTNKQAFLKELDGLVKVARSVLAEEGKGPPPKWDAYLKAKWDGGKKKVPNPNKDTKDKYKEVSMSTAMKDKSFAKGVMEDYSKWIAKNTKEKSRGYTALTKKDKVEVFSELKSAIKEHRKSEDAPKSKNSDLAKVYRTSVEKTLVEVKELLTENITPQKLAHKVYDRWLDVSAKARLDGSRRWEDRYTAQIQTHLWMETLRALEKVSPELSLWKNQEDWDDWDDVEDSDESTSKKED